MSDTTITFVTGNANKLREVVAILCDNTDNNNAETCSKVGKYRIINEKIDLDEIQGSIEDVTIHKAKQAAEIVNGAVLVEDTCLGFNAYNNLPGPYIKWFVKSIGLNGLVKMLENFDDKSANAITTFGFCQGPGKEVLLFQGITNGQIVSSTGPTDFGWDSIFKPDGFQTTYAEMKGNEKNKISQRSKALAKVKEYLTK
ncbi:nucleoside triphosphate pyrophosphohydrolase ham1 [Pichia californica]|uniref:Inosine triphosphate pyrophosphatase n=1 Tax=Pichia californica TaxID=460514 RepID=A0A9P7BHZ2_9ASCO|nr:nucleoside triphosphate pyrophosphohydrolase ham1 [[Candida] californica]KAG0691220.1 nucleoside triphosphate pyrophosphohydrolase ham1 [[Candida] californica]